jgi:toxin-antitoxin system PIN domain toxin
VILSDVNLLLYAYHRPAKEHDRAVFWLKEVFSAAGIVPFSWDTILAFLRIAAHPRILAHPFEFQEAVEIVDDWLSRPNVTIVSPTEQRWQVFSKLLRRTRARSSLIMDAHLVALAIEHGATLCTKETSQGSPH